MDDKSDPVFFLCDFPPVPALAPAPGRGVPPFRLSSVRPDPDPGPAPGLCVDNEDDDDDEPCPANPFSSTRPPVESLPPFLLSFLDIFCPFGVDPAGVFSEGELIPALRLRAVGFFLIEDEDGDAEVEVEGVWSGWIGGGKAEGGRIGIPVDMIFFLKLMVSSGYSCKGWGSCREEGGRFEVSFQLFDRFGRVRGDRAWGLFPG